MRVLVADIEADGFLDQVTTIHQVSIAEKIGGTWQVESYNAQRSPAWKTLALKHMSQADMLVMHNGITYDYPVMEKVWGSTPNVELMDTLVLSRLGNPERPGGHSLEAWGETLGVFKVKHEDWERWSPAMEQRCNQDALINAMVWDRLQDMLQAMPVAVDIEMKTAKAIFRMTRVGIHFDQRQAQHVLGELMDKAEAAKAEVAAMMPWVYDPKGEPRSLKVVNRRHWGHGILEPGVLYQEVTHRKLQVSSRQDVVRYLKMTYGWNPTQKTKTGQAQVNDEVLRGLPWPEAQVLADYFKTWKTIGYLNGERKNNGSGGGWLHHVTPQGKLHAGFIPLTAVTGRPSCVAPNLQQVPSDPEIRALFKPRPGWKMVGVDADGQELRCLGHYLHRYDQGDYGREVVEGDIHTRVQNLIGFHTRKGTKPVEYGLIYGAGDEKLGLISLKDAMDAGAEMKVPLKKRGKQIRKAIMNGLRGFEQLMKDVRARAAQRGRLRGLDGRTLWVRSPHSALNLVLQSAGIIHMKMTIAMMEEYLKDVGLEIGDDYELILWVHDELQFECKPEYAELLGKTAAQCVESAAVRLGFRVPMSGTYSIGDNWSETH